jgi:hypothetical protein
VPEFLSPAWVDALDDALDALDTQLEPPDESPGEVTVHDRFVLEQRVNRPDGSTHVHHLIAADGSFHAAHGPAPEPDLVITTDLGTAVAIQRGALNAQLALAAGHLRLGGDLDQLRSHAALFERLDDVFGDLRAATTYPTDSAPETRTRPS